MKKIAPVYFGVTDNRSRVAEERYIDAKRRRDAVQEMFAEEIRMERRKKDPCYKCAYNCHALCIGFCYQQMTAHPVDPNEKIQGGKIMFGFDKMFDFNRGGKLDSWERAAQFQFMDEI